MPCVAGVCETVFATGFVHRVKGFTTKAHTREGYRSLVRTLRRISDWTGMSLALTAFGFGVDVVFGETPACRRAAGATFGATVGLTGSILLNPRFPAFTILCASRLRCVIGWSRVKKSTKRGITPLVGFLCVVNCI
jgi:hypothetical protein